MPLVVTSLAEAVPLPAAGRICALTGAGRSVAAALAAFRGSGGLWTVNPDWEQALDAAYVPGNVALMWTVWGGVLAQARPPARPPLTERWPQRTPS